MSSVDFLVIGHVCKDVTPAGFRLGGTVTYAALMARNLGARAGILTRASKDLFEAIPGGLASPPAERWTARSGAGAE